MAPFTRYGSVQWDSTVTSALTKAVAVIVLAVAAWLVLKLALHVVAFVAWIVAAVLLVIVIWAISTLRATGAGREP